jgi:hypothetical protein
MNPQGALRVVDLMQELVLELAAHPQALTFVPQEQTGGPVSCSGPGPAVDKKPKPSPSCGGMQTR